LNESAHNYRMVLPPCSHHKLHRHEPYSHHTH